MLVFATIFGVGFVMLLLNLIFGADADADIDTDVADGPDVGSGPSVFGLKMVALLMSGFGIVGFAMRATTEASMFMSSMAGIGGAVVVATAGYFILRVFYISQASSTITDQDVVGTIANLIDAIPENGNGQVACVVRGREVTYIARSSDGQALDRGASVRIISKSGAIVTVVPSE